MKITIIILIVYFINLLCTFLYCFKKQHSKKVYTNKEYEYELDNKRSVKTYISRVIQGFIRWKLIVLGKFPSHVFRNFVLKYIYRMDIKKSTIIYGGFEIREPWNISIGKHSIIGDNVKLDGRNGIFIGDNVNFSTGVWIWTDQHDMNDPYFRCLNQGGKVIIEDRAWISCRVTILPKINIKEGAVIAAGAVVTKDCENFGVYGGVPAKKIANRNRELLYQLDGNYMPFF